MVLYEVSGVERVGGELEVFIDVISDVFKVKAFEIMKCRD